MQNLNIQHCLVVQLTKCLIEYLVITVIDDEYKSSFWHIEVFPYFVYSPAYLCHSLLEQEIKLVLKCLYYKKNHPARIHILSVMNYIKEVEKIEQKLHAKKVDLNFISKDWKPIKHLF